MTSVERLRGVLRAHPFLVDVVIAAGVGVVTLLVPHPDAEPGQLLPPAAMVPAGVACLVLVARRRRPRTTFAMSVLGTGATIALAQGHPIFTFAEAIAIYTVAVRSDRRTTAAAFGLSALVLTVVILSTPAGQQARSLLAAVTGLLAINAIAAALGDAVRSQRASVAAVKERAVRAEHSREEEARRQVVEERLRIARELHDVVAHHVAVVSVQAGLAEHLVLTKPHAAQQALHHVRSASAAILDELSGILTVLRQPDEPGSGRTPAPGLGRLDDLLGSYVDAGLSVRSSVSGQPRDLSGSMDLVAYRVVQEALTNAHKHGADAARVAVTYTPQAVVLDIANPVCRPVTIPHRDGHGLTGMRERAAAVGGDLQVGSDAPGEFRVTLTLPAP